ncbi:hypothetical protein AZZ81_001415, partial [Klebsiella aerogenes]
HSFSEPIKKTIFGVFFNIFSFYYCPPKINKHQLHCG